MTLSQVRKSNKSIPTILFAFTFLLFIICSGYVARRLKPGIIPDEGYHTNLSKQYAMSFSIPVDSPETYRFGNISHKPFLYYWINGRVINLLELVKPSPSYWKILTALRVVNVFYASLSFLFCFLLGVEITKNRWWAVFVVFLLANTMMFVFLSGGVSYDNLANLCGFAGIYFLVRVLKQNPFYTNSFGWLIFILMGTLVKSTLVPLAAIMGLVWLVHVWQNRSSIKFPPHFNWKFISLFVLMSGLLVLNFSIYGINVIQYKSLAPSCNKILTEEQCSKSAVVERDQKVHLLETITLRDILQGKYPDPANWFFNYWLPAMVRHIFGFLGHRTYFPDFITGYYQFIVFLVFALAVKFWGNAPLVIKTLAITAIFYILILLRFNYSAELSNGFLHFGIQGRYTFPVLSILYTLAGYFTSKMESTTIRRITTVYILLVFAAGSPLAAYFLKLPEILPKRVIHSEKTLGEIVGGVEISQTFISQCKGSIDQIELLFATYLRTNTQDVTIRIFDQTNNQTISEHTVPGVHIRDNTWHLLNIHQLANTFDKQYRIQITSPLSTTGNAFTIWASQADQLSGKQAFVNGQPTGLTINYRYRCSQQLLLDWFY